MIKVDATKACHVQDFSLDLPPSDNELFLDARFNTKSGRRIPINWKWVNDLYILGRRPNIIGSRPVWGVYGKIIYPENRLWRSDIQNRFKLFYDSMSEWLGIGDRYVVVNGPWIKALANGPTPRLIGRLLVWGSYNDFVMDSKEENERKL